MAVKDNAEIDYSGERDDASQVLLYGRLAAALHRLNNNLPHDTIEEVVRTLSRPPHPTLIQNNRWFHAMLTDGVEVECRDAKSGETRGGRARLVDFDNPERERSNGTTPALRRRSIGQYLPPGPDRCS